MKLQKPTKVVLIGDTKGVEGLFLYFNQKNPDLAHYSPKPLTDGSVVQAIGVVGAEKTPILAFSDNDTSMMTLNALVNAAEKISIGFVVSFNERCQKILEKYMKWLKSVNPEVLSRIVCFMDLVPNDDVSFKEFGYDSSFGPADFMPIDILSIGYEKETKKLVQIVDDILPDSHKQLLLRAFDVLFYPISISLNVGLEPSATALLMETDT